MADISIIKTYATRKGYGKESSNKYWVAIEAYITLIPRKYIKICGTENSGG